MTTEPVIRPGRPDDAEAIGAIYNHYISFSVAHFGTQPLDDAYWRNWIAQFAEEGRYRLFVAEGDGVHGFAHSTRYNERQAYDRTVMTSVYLRPGLTGRGLGARLYTVLFEALKATDMHRTIAGITLPNPASVALHKRFGFYEIGTMSEAGFKFGRYHDVLWMERKA